MRSKISLQLSLALGLRALAVPTTSGIALAQTETVLHSFDDMTGDGDSPGGGLVCDTSGNLYGTTTAGGAPFTISGQFSS